MFEDNSYQQASVQYGTRDAEYAPVMKLAEWIATWILLILPVVNIIMLFVWAFDQKGNPNRRNFARASLIMFASGMILSAYMLGSVIGTLGSLISQL